MAYIFDPLRNTFIDDEDTSLGNKLALVDDDELEKAIKQIDDKFGPGTVFPASDLPENKPAEVEQTEQFNRFNKLYQDGGRVNFAAAGLALPALSYPVNLGIAKILGITTAGVGATELGNKVTDYLFKNPEIINDPRFKAAALTFGINIPGVIAPDADEMEREAEKIREMTKPTGFPAETEKMPIKTGETTPPEIDTREEFPKEEQKLPITTGGSEIPEQTLKDFIFYNKKSPIVQKEKVTSAERAKSALEELNPETVTELQEIIKNYRESRTRGDVYVEPKSGRVRKDREPSTQPIMSEADKVELLQMVVDKYKEKENKLPSSTELKGLFPFLSESIGSIASKGNIELGKRTSDYDRSDPEYVERMQLKAQLRADENNTISNYGGKNYFPKTIQLKDGSVVNAEKFFIDNLAKRTELGPSRKEAKDTTLTNIELAKLFNTNVRKIESAISIIRKSPDFKADFPEPRSSNYNSKIAAERIANARKYITGKELANIKLQEQELKKLNDMFKDGTLVVLDFPKIVKSMNTTADKNTGKLDHSIKKTDKEMIERSKNNVGLFDISHTIPKTSDQQNIEFLRNRNVADYKTNQGLYKSFEAYVKNRKDDPEYELRLKEFDDYMKEMGQAVKIGNRFFGYREEMFNSETGEFTGINRQLEYYGLPKFKQGIPLKKIKKATGGPIELSPMPRANFGNGGAAGADDDFATQLEYFFLNPDVELPAAKTFRETMNPVSIINDMIDPRNIPYYADRLVQSGIRIGEFGARVLPAVGQLAADLIQKPAFKIKASTNQGYVQDYDEQPLPLSESRIEGTGIFTDFLNNLVGSEGTDMITEKSGLGELIESEEQKMKDRRATAGAKILADQLTLGMEVTAPIFPGLKLLQTYSKSRKLPVNNETKKVMEKEIDEVLTAQGTNRRDFLKATGAGGAVILAKMLGLGDEVATVTKVAEKAVPAANNAPPYFFTLVDKIRALGRSGPGTKERSESFIYGDYEMEIDYDTGAIDIKRTEQAMFGDEIAPVEEVTMTYRPGKADETTGGKTPPDEYEEYTARPDEDGKMKDIEEGVPEDVIDEGSISKEELEQLIIRNLNSD